MAKKKARKPAPASSGRPWKLFVGDCLTKVPEHLPVGQATLAAFDPPYNAGQAYSDYMDRRTQKEYLDWLKLRIEVCAGRLHPHASLWVAINDANVSELDVICKNELGLYPRRKITWFFTFGQNNSRNFTQSHITWLYYTRHRTEFIFNAEDPAVRIPSARQLVYNDKRANSKGRLPDDFWILRPQELPDAFKPHQDCWYFSRVCGTFKAKMKESPNQMPVRMMDRIVRFCSNPGDLVVDIFNGTGTTGEASILAGRRYAGFDVSAGCIEASEQRLSAAMARQAAAEAAAAEQLSLFDPPGKSRKRRRMV